MTNTTDNYDTNTNTTTGAEVVNKDASARCNLPFGEGEEGLKEEGDVAGGDKRAEEKDGGSSAADGTGCGGERGGGGSGSELSSPAAAVNASAGESAEAASPSSSVTVGVVAAAAAAGGVPAKLIDALMRECMQVCPFFVSDL